MKIALQEHQNVSGQGIRSQCSDTHLAYGPTAPGTHIFVYFDNRQVSSGVSFWSRGRPLGIWKWNQNSVNTSWGKCSCPEGWSMESPLPLPSFFCLWIICSVSSSTEILRRLWYPRSPGSESRAKGRLNHNGGLLKCSPPSRSLQSWQRHLLPKTPHSCSTRGCMNTRSKAQGSCTPAWKHVSLTAKSALRKPAVRV